MSREKFSSRKDNPGVLPKIVLDLESKVVRVRSSLGSLRIDYSKLISFLNQERTPIHTNSKDGKE
jgi:hypothetical protein